LAFLLKAVASIRLGLCPISQNLVQREAISKEELERRLTPAARALLERPIAPALWYDIGAVTQLVLLLWEIEGDRDPEYLLKRGAEVSACSGAVSIHSSST